MSNIAKYCVRYLWDHHWSPIRSPTLTVVFFSLFHLIMFTNLIASRPQFMNNSPVSNCEDTCCRKSSLYRKWVSLTSPSPSILMLLREAVLDAGTDPPGMLNPSSQALLLRGWWLSPHPCTPCGCSSENFHPTKFIWSGWCSQLGSWMRLSPSPVLKLWNCWRTVSHLFWYKFLWESC